MSPFALPRRSSDCPRGASTSQPNGYYRGRAGGIGGRDQNEPLVM